MIACCINILLTRCNTLLHLLELRVGERVIEAQRDAVRQFNLGVLFEIAQDLLVRLVSSSNGLSFYFTAYFQGKPDDANL